MTRYMIGVIVALLVAIGGVGWLYQQQSEQIGQLQSERNQLAADLQSSEAERKRQHEQHLQDQALVAQTNQQIRILQQQSQTDQRLTREELKDEACANTPLPESIVNRLRDRLHRQTRDSAGSPTG